MTLSDLSIKRPVFAWMLMVALILFGFLAYKRMGVSQLPDVDMPVVSVSLTYDGAAPEGAEEFGTCVPKHLVIFERRPEENRRRYLEDLPRLLERGQHDKQDGNGRPGKCQCDERPSQDDRQR